MWHLWLPVFARRFFKLQRRWNIWKEHGVRMSIVHYRTTYLVILLICMPDWLCDLCIWLIIESLQAVSARGGWVWRGEPASVIILELESRSSHPQTVPWIRNTDTSARVKCWQLLMRCLVTVKCERLGTRCFEFLSFSRGALQDKSMSIYASTLRKP